MTILRRRSRMISFRLSEDEYANLRSLCEEAGARSVSDIARDAVHRLIRMNAQSHVEVALRTLEDRVDSLDSQVRRLEIAVDGVPEQAVARRANGKV